MTLESRIAEAEQKFNTKQAEREQLLKQAEEVLTEMTKLQGEWRVLNEIKEDVPPSVEVVDEGKPKKASK